MAGRGRGRGRGLSINIEALGLGRGEVIPTVAQPPPLYPPLLFRGGIPSRTPELDYMVALRQELRYSFHKSPYYINTSNKSKDIERYSDKYSAGANDVAQRWEPDWTMFPTELQDKKKRKAKPSSAKPNLKAARKAPDVSQLLQKFEKTDDTAEKQEEEENETEEAEKGVKKEKKEEGDNEEEEEEIDEEDFEEDNDYLTSYFDNGEGYGDDDEDDDEGPTY